MTTLIQSTSPRDEKLRQTFLVMQSLVVSTFLYLALALYLAITTRTWQSVVFTIVAGVAEVLVFVDINLVRRGQIKRAGWLLLGMNSFGAVSASLLYVNLGYVAIAYVLITNFFIIRYLISEEARRSGWVITATALLIPIFAEVFNPAWRQSTQLLLTLSPIITIALGAAFLIVVGYEAWRTSMRNKLLVALIGTILVTSGGMQIYVYVTTNTILRQGLEKELTQHTHGVADQISGVFNEQINTLQALALNEVIEQTPEKINESYKGNAKTIQTTLNTKDTQWRAADAANNDADPLVEKYLTNDASKELKEFQKSFPGNAEVFITDKYGGLVGTTNRTSDFLQSDEAWWQAAYNNGEGAVYISQPEYDQSAGALAVLIALPIHSDETGEIVGILRTTYLASSLNPILGEALGETGETDLFVQTEDAIFHYNGKEYTQFDSGKYQEIQSAGLGMLEMDYEGTPSIVLQSPVRSVEGNQVLDNLGWVIMFHQQQDEAFGPVIRQTRGILLVMAVFLFLAVAAAFAVSLFLVQPITHLTKTAEEIAAGNFNSRANITSTDEIGTLASTFNSMTSQLQETLQNLEQRVAARTKDLATVAEVGTATATILESSRLLQEVVNLTKERFNLYHSHIYLLDREGKNLVLTAGAGEPGRIMVAEKRSIPLDREQSLVARAARERKGVTVNDVTLAPDFLPNPLLPDTRSELAVPMIVGGTVIGVFDIQSEQVGRFTESDVNIQTTLAAQLATSIQNVRSFEQSRKQAELESLVNTIGQRIQRATSIEETLQTAIRELGSAVGASRVSVNIAGQQDAGNNAGQN